MNGEPQSAANETESRFSREYWLVFVASLMLGIADNLFVLFPAFVADLGASPSIIGAVLGLGSLAALAFRPGATGAIARYGQRATSLWFLILDAIAVLLYIPIGGIGAPLWAIRAFHGAIDGTARVALFAMIYPRLPAGSPGYGMAIFSLSSIVPAAVAPPLGEALIHVSGFTGFFIVCAIMLIGAGAATVPISEAARGPREVSAEKANYRALLTDRNLIRLWIASSVFSLALTARFSFVVPFAYGDGLKSVGWYFLLAAGIAAAVRAVSSRALDAALDRSVVPALAVLAIGTGMIAGVPNVAILVAAAVVGGVGQGFSYPAISALIIEGTPAGAAGHSSAIFNSIFDAIGIAGPYLLGLLAQAAGYRAMFIATGAMAIAGALASSPRKRVRI